MVWLSKRELAYYIVLKRVFGYNQFNLGEALDILKYLGSKRIARKIIRRLAKRGFIQKINEVNYRVMELEPALINILSRYIFNRMYKSMRSQNTPIKIIEKELRIIVHGNCMDRNLEVLGRSLSDIMYIECKENH
ncbi:hypothetical protein Igag_0213 [Ignisphaera aggregans DSM 17230]|uniref:Uncharacterized protein n=1 Tax=Ignisphaera aggregans (strain DSM 17230 / JCM 13409 / AQ1.S1) TaxID=583356 RepID=E0SQB2_IGNAA|nr:hypothetical protein Igag_0213 [Ignisphaera aggregans DSM 17230]